MNKSHENKTCDLFVLGRDTGDGGWQVSTAQLKVRLGLAATSLCKINLTTCVHAQVRHACILQGLQGSGRTTFIYT